MVGCGRSSGSRKRTGGPRSHERACHRPISQENASQSREKPEVPASKIYSFDNKQLTSGTTDFTALPGRDAIRRMTDSRSPLAEMIA